MDNNELDSDVMPVTDGAAPPTPPMAAQGGLAAEPFEDSEAFEDSESSDDTEPFDGTEELDDPGVQAAARKRRRGSRGGRNRKKAKRLSQRPTRASR